MSREGFMARAIACAKKAAALGEVPVGAVIVHKGKVIATGYNRRETDKNALLHAEIIAINRACKKLGGWRLSDCELYVTLEPCPMCTGAIINARISTVYIGAMDPKAGCMGSLCDLTKLPFNHQPQIVSGVLERECSDLLSQFFQTLRQKPQPKSIALRSFTFDDVPVLKRYLYSKRSDKSVYNIVEAWNTKILEGRYNEMFAVTVDGSVVGYVQLTEQSDGSVSLEVFIFSDYRGKTYGTQSARALLSLAKDKGYSVITAQVRSENIPSCRLCQRVGFVPVGDDVTQRGVSVRNMLYSQDN
ncbi:MAG: tRNA adenosine(34) deaminase TadA [Clostridia bacterium]|nr:tRNA adenosine(34) deaminase TadA [Clostridia bacterium]